MNLGKDQHFLLCSPLIYDDLCVMANRKRHILIIDDNEDIVNMMRLMLQMKNYDVSAQMSVTGLEETLNKTWPDLIIMDMLLSGADGRVVCRFLKDSDHYNHIPVLMISAHPSAKKECIDAGADAFLEKPFDMQEFFNAVGNTLPLKQD